MYMLLFAAKNVISYNIVPQGVEHYNGMLFVTTPRRNRGIPSTLNYIDIKNNNEGQSPKLRPWPNAEMNSLHVS